MIEKCQKSLFRKIIRRSVLVFLVAGIAVSYAQAEVKQLSMGTATVGGVFYNLGSPLAQCVNKALPDVNITAEITQGTTENMRLIQQKKMQLAVITPFIDSFARQGVKMFKGTPIDFASWFDCFPMQTCGASWPSPKHRVLRI